MKKLILILLVMITISACNRNGNKSIIEGLPSIGKGQPLYVVDGVVTSKTEVAKIKVNDVLKLSSINKPTSVALYGKKGENGVFFIDTKKGLLNTDR